MKQPRSNGRKFISKKESFDWKRDRRRTTRPYHSIAAVLVDITAMEPKSGRVFDDTNLRVEWSRACEAVGLGKRVKQTSKSGNIWYAYEGLIVHDLRRKSEVTRRGRCSTAITLSAPMMSPTRCRKL